MTARGEASAKTKQFERLVDGMKTSGRVDRVTCGIESVVVLTDAHAEGLPKAAYEILWNYCAGVAPQSSMVIRQRFGKEIARLP